MDWAGLELRPLRGGAEENLEGAGGNKVRERRDVWSWLSLSAVPEC